jgi:hypothetical protein
MGKAHRHSMAEVADETTTLLVAGGQVMLILFPLALPILALVAVAALPFLVVPLVGVLGAALVAAPFLIVRGVGRRLLRGMRRTGAGERRASPAHQRL